MTSEQRIAEWAITTYSKMSSFGDALPDGFYIAHLESAARTLIASVRAEAIEECAKVAEDYQDDNPYPTVYASIAAAIRALVKERKGEE